MPIVINEIVIKVDVTPGLGSQDSSSTSPEISLKDSIVKECVEKIMEILNLKNER